VQLVNYMDYGNTTSAPPIDNTFLLFHDTFYVMCINIFVYLSLIDVTISLLFDNPDTMTVIRITTRM